MPKRKQRTCPGPLALVHPAWTGNVLWPALMHIWLQGIRKWAWSSLTKDSRADLDKWKHISQREGLFHILWKIKFMFETTSQKCISAYLNYARLICSESPLLTISTPVNWVQSDKPSCACLHMFVRRLSPVQNIHHNVINHWYTVYPLIYTYIYFIVNNSSRRILHNPWWCLLIIGFTILLGSVLSL